MCYLLLRNCCSFYAEATLGHITMSLAKTTHDRGWSAPTGDIAIAKMGNVSVTKVMTEWLVSGRNVLKIATTADFAFP